MPRYTYRAEYVRCGRSCGGCPHGPYWYGYWREGGRLKKRYFGRQDPRVPPAEGPALEPRSWDRIFRRDTASVPLALEILGIDPETSRDVARTVYRQLSLRHHPDRGGDARQFQYLEAAWSYLRAARNW
jgi:hypothetical protein